MASSSLCSQKHWHWFKMIMCIFFHYDFLKKKLLIILVHIGNICSEITERMYKKIILTKALIALVLHNNLAYVASYLN